jgi:hypothetical protein
MDRHQFTLLDTLKKAALATGEIRLYQRGRLPGLFAQRTRLHAEIANEAVRAGWLEVIRVESVGKTNVEWVRISQKGLDYLLESESPARALDDLRSVLASTQENFPAWLTDMHARLDDLARRFSAELEQVRLHLEQMSRRAVVAMERIEQAQNGTPKTVPWAQEVLRILENRKQVGLGERCALADLFAPLKEQHQDLTLREFHQGLKRLHERQLVTLLADVPNGDAPAPEYALLDGSSVYYYVARGRE